MKNVDELIKRAKELYSKLGGIGNPDARLIRGLIELIERQDKLINELSIQLQKED